MALDDKGSQQTTPDTSKSGQSEFDVISTSLRRKNPLGWYSSYTYNLTLYMATPEAIGKFVSSGGKFQRSDTGFYIVAQSGGISDREPRLMTNTGSLGPGPGLDFYIDDLSFEILMPGGNSPAVGTQINFKIYEPYGFTFFTKMADACNRLNALSPVLQSGPKPNLFQQHYIIGIRFYGYDKEGNIVSGKEFSKIERSASNVVDNETALTDDSASFERFFPVIMSRATYKLDGKAVVYNVECASINLQTGFDAKRGIVKKHSSITAATVGEALQGEGKSSNSSRGLMQILNEHEQEQFDNKIIAKKNSYNIEWKLDESIKTEKISANLDVGSKRPVQPGITKTSDVSVAKAEKAQSIPAGKQNIPIPAGSSILSVIDHVISNSEYVSKALTAENTTAIETATKKNQAIVELKWFSVNPVVKPLEFDAKLHDWTYDITYQIQEYKVPYLKFLYKAAAPRYYGPHKTYNFFLTGENTEVINYEQSYDNQFYIISAMTTANQVDATNDTGTVPIRPLPTAGNNSLAAKQNRGSEINKLVRANIASVADQATATIKIIGDPDYLMQNISAAPSFTSSTFKKLYGSDGYSINPYGGQIFIEIVFKLAEDYSNVDGLLDVSDKIKFYSTFDASQSKIKGVVYRVIGVKNNFSRGQFTQDVDLILIQDSQLNLQGKGVAAPEETAREQSRTGPDVPNNGRGLSPGATKEDFVRAEQDARLRGGPNSSLGKGTAATGRGVDETKLSVNERINRAITGDGDESQTAINRLRGRLGIPVGGTGGMTRTIPTQVGPVADDEGKTPATYPTTTGRGVDETKLPVNERINRAITGGGDESQTAINRLRGRLGIPVGGTGGGP